MTYGLLERINNTGCFSVVLTHVIPHCKHSLKSEIDWWFSLWPHLRLGEVPWGRVRGFFEIECDARHHRLSHKPPFFEEPSPLWLVKGRGSGTGRQKKLFCFIFLSEGLWQLYVSVHLLQMFWVRIYVRSSHSQLKLVITKLKHKFMFHHWATTGPPLGHPAIL